MRIRDAGDAAVLLELDDVIDPRVNEAAAGIAAAMRAAALPGVRDVVSTYRSVAVYVDPVLADLDRVRAALAASLEAPGVTTTSRTIEVPVTYGGDAGPDLAEVAACAGLTEAEVVARHSGTAYRVFMLGFLPGFAYMGPVDDRIAAPRHATPRLRVAPGSVGIAGRQTGIYPLESPGGWRIIGRTPLAVFDPARTPAPLFATGDTVRFVPVPPTAASADIVGAGFSRPDPQSPATRRVTVISPGLFTTIQDRGRWGHQSSGVPVAGPMDADAHAAANSAVGNPEDAASLEVTLTGPVLRFEQETVIAVTGADLGATLDGVPVEPGAPHIAGDGSTLRFGERLAGTRAYVAVDGGVDVPPVLGSRATHVLSRLGGLHGRALAAGDRVPLGPPGRATTARRGRAVVVLPRGGARLRVLAGPQDDRFTPDALEALQRRRFQISPQSNRLGFRLTGARLPSAQAEMISDATFTGGIQVPPSGEPILLMTDRQTTGGYPQIATVISADLPLAGQLAPGDWVEFEVCSRAAAVAALR